MRHHFPAMRCLSHTRLLAVILGLALFSAQDGLAAWKNISGNLVENNMGPILYEPETAHLLVATGPRLYRTMEGERQWDCVLRLEGDESIHTIYRSIASDLYLLTRNQAWKSTDGGENWARLPILPESEGSELNSISVHPQDPEIIFLGTSRGLHWSLDGGLHWIRQQGVLGHEKIRLVLHHPLQESEVFAATEEELYRSRDAGNSFARSHHFRFLRENFADDPLEIQEEGLDPKGITPPASPLVKISPTRPREVYVATSHEILKSEDGGDFWKNVPTNGLGRERIMDIEISGQGDTVYVATESGIHCLAGKARQWTPMSEGRLGTPVHSLEWGESHWGQTLYATSTDEVFEWRLLEGASRELPVIQNPPLEPERVLAFQKVLANEPSIAEMQQVAIRYAHLSQGKIRRWHWASRVKSLIPDLALSKDISTANSIDIDRGATNAPDVYISGPDTQRFSQELRLDWKLGELIWGDDQTAIDSRNKILVEFRNDLLGDLTRLYYERRRLLMELYLGPPLAKKEYLDLLLRIDELTAYLDGYTDGYYSQEIRRRGVPYL